MMATQRKQEHGRRYHRRLLLLAAATLLSSSAVRPVQAYVTSGLPGHRHRSWLKKMTRDIVDAPPGALTPENLAAAPQLMAVWAENPYVPSSSRWSSPPPGSGASPQHPSSAGPCSPPAPAAHADHGLECALEVEALLKRLVDEQRAAAAAGTDEDEVYNAVTTEVYNAVLFAWANSGKGVSAAERAEQILIQMQEMYEAGDTEVQPDAQSFRAVLLAWSNAAHRGSQDEQKRLGAQRSERILEYMAHLDDTLLDADCFDAVLRLWSSSGLPDAPLRAERLLAVMDQLYLDGNEACRLRASSFDEVLTAWCRRNSISSGKKNYKKADSDAADADLDEDPLVAEAPRRAEAILTHMERLSRENTGFLLGDSVAPNLASYTSVASAWGRSGGQLGAQKATKILGRLEKRYLSSINTSAAVSSKKTAKAETTRESGSASENNANALQLHRDLRPDTALYNTCIDAWVKARAKDSYRQARSILDRQIAAAHHGVTGGGMRRRCRPDVYSYTLVLHACAAYSGTLKEKKKAFAVAERTYEELLEASGKGVNPNHVTFGIMMKAVARLLPKGSDQRERFGRKLFERARREGCVGRMVVCRLREAVCAESYKEIMGGATKKNLPSEWISRVPESDRR